MRVARVSLVKELLGLYRVVIVGWVLVRSMGRGRSRMDVSVRHRKGHRGTCGRCGELSPWYDRGGGDGSSDGVISMPAM